MSRLRTNKLLVLCAATIVALLSLASCGAARSASSYDDYVREYDANDENYNYWEETDDYEIDLRGY